MFREKKGYFFLYIQRKTQHMKKIRTFSQFESRIDEELTSKLRYNAMQKAGNMMYSRDPIERKKAISSYKSLSSMPHLNKLAKKTAEMVAMDTFGEEYSQSAVDFVLSKDGDSEAIFVVSYDNKEILGVRYSAGGPSEIRRGQEIFNKLGDVTIRHLNRLSQEVKKDFVRQ
jgi:hypothetical protein